MSFETSQSFWDESAPDPGADDSRASWFDAFDAGQFEQTPAGLGYDYQGETDATFFDVAGPYFSAFENYEGAPEYAEQDGPTRAEQIDAMDVATGGNYAADPGFFESLANFGAGVLRGLGQISLSAGTAAPGVRNLSGAVSGGTAPRTNATTTTTTPPTLAPGASIIPGVSNGALILGAFAALGLILVATRRR